MCSYQKKINKFADTTEKTAPRSPNRKPEDKAQKEKRNQTAGQQIKEKASVLKREKPLTSGRSASTTETPSRIPSARERSISTTTATGKSNL